MKTTLSNDTVRITGLKELGAASAGAVREQARAALAGGLCNVEIDLSETAFVDSCGLGALVALHQTVAAQKGKLRLVNPAPRVRQILELTRLHRVLEIVDAAAGSLAELQPAGDPAAAAPPLPATVIEAPPADAPPPAAS